MDPLAPNIRFGFTPSTFSALFQNKQLGADEPQRRKTYLLACAPNDNSNQPAHPHEETLYPWLSKMCLVTILIRVRECVQADLNFRLVHMSDGSISDVAALMIYYQWVSAWQNQHNCMCAQRRLRSARASAQSDQSLRSPLYKSLGPLLLTERTVKTLISLGRSPGWSDSSLGAHTILLVLSCAGSLVIK